MSETLTINFGKPLPLFPLPNCVLLPHSTIPLHIFELRYRQLVGDALDSRGMVAMALIDPEDRDEHVADVGIQPRVMPFVCVGYIARHHRLPDGRYNLLMQGLCRARLIEEIPHEPYRAAMLEPIESRESMEIDLSDHREQLRSLLEHPKLQELTAIAGIQRWYNDDLPTPVLVDLCITAITDDVGERYMMLTESSPETRADWLIENLQRTVHTLQIAERFVPEESEDGSTPN